MGKPTWINYGRNQPVFARSFSEPEGLQAVRQQVRQATLEKRRLRAVATGLSFSDILQTHDALMDVTKVVARDHAQGLLPNQRQLWKDPFTPEARVRVSAGARIRTLNQLLKKAGLAFSNLGGFDYQTVIGATSTSTHGSGIDLPPFCDLIRSMWLVTTGGRLVQLEPSNGITDPAKFANYYGGSDIELVQDDGLFWSAVVSLGCMGVIYSMTMAVMPRYLLSERRVVVPWSELRPQLAQGRGGVIGRHRHVEVLVSPYEYDGERPCLLTMRDIPKAGTLRHSTADIRNPLTALSFSDAGQKLVLAGISDIDGLAKGFAKTAVTGLANAEPHIDEGYRIYNVGDVNRAKVISAEYSFPIEGGVFLDAVEALAAVAEDNARQNLFMISPLAMRFVRHSDATLSMMYGRDTCTVETPVFSGLPGAETMIRSYEGVAYRFSGRPHWGQINTLTHAPGWLASSYPASEQWLRAFRHFNAEGVFDNPFTDRMGFSQRPQAVAVAPEAVP